MARFLGKTSAGDEVFAYDFKAPEVKAIGDYEIELVGSTEDIDRDGEVLMMDGWDLRSFKKNPVVLPSHMYFEPAIGRAKVSKQDGKLMFKIEFPENGINPVADVYRKLYKNGFMNAASVGFIPKDYVWGENENEPRRTFNKQELIEISLVSVPANPNALVTEKSIQTAVKAGALRNDDIKALEDYVKRCFDPGRPKVFLIKGVTDEKEVDETEVKDEGDSKEQLYKEITETLVRIEKKIDLIPHEIKVNSHYFNELMPSQVRSTTADGISETIKSKFKR